LISMMYLYIIIKKLLYTFDILIALKYNKIIIYIIILLN
jgi:hypothetical protein